MNVHLKIAKERFPIEVEVTEDRKGATASWQGGSKWISQPPSDLHSGDYDELVFNAREFKQAYTPGELISFTPTTRDTKK